MTVSTANCYLESIRCSTTGREAGLVTNDHCSSFSSGSTVANLSSWYLFIQDVVAVGPRSSRGLLTKGVLLPEFGCLAEVVQIGELRAMTAVLVQEISTFVWDPRPGSATGDAAHEVPAQFSVPSAVTGGRNAAHLGD